MHANNTALDQEHEGSKTMNEQVVNRDKQLFYEKKSSNDNVHEILRAEP